MIVQPPGFLTSIRYLCDQYDVLLFCDEVATGFGRTGGRMFASQHEGVTPDLMAVAKGLTGGYFPLAATLATEEVFQAFLGRPEEGKTFFHGHTYTGNPLACAAAIACLDLFEKERTLERMRPLLHDLGNELTVLYGLPWVGEIRYRGLMIGIELVRDTGTREPFPPELRMGHRVILEARRRGAILRPLGDVVVLMPPLTVTRRELHTLCRIVYDSVETVCGKA